MANNEEKTSKVKVRETKEELLKKIEELEKRVREKDEAMRAIDLDCERQVSNKNLLVHALNADKERLARQIVDLEGQLERAHKYITELEKGMGGIFRIFKRK